MGYRETSAGERWALASGIIFVPLAIVPDFALASELQTASYLRGLGAMCFLVFLGGLLGVLQRAEDGAGSRFPLALGSGIAFVTLVLLAQVGWLSLASVTALGSTPETRRALEELARLALGVAQLPAAVFVATASAAMLRTRVTPRWVGWLGLAAAVMQGVGTVGHNNALGLFGFIGFLLFLIWTLATSVGLLLRSRTPQPASQAVPA